MTDKASPKQSTAKTAHVESAKWHERVNWTAVSAICTILLVLGVFWSRFDAMHDRITTTVTGIRTDLGGRLDKQTEAIAENTKGLAVLNERVSGLEERVSGIESRLETDINRLENTINTDVNRLEGKIDDFLKYQKTSY